jgi:hypothetical protein
VLPTKILPSRGKTSTVHESVPLRLTHDNAGQLEPFQFDVTFTGQPLTQLMSPRSDEVIRFDHSLPVKSSSIVSTPSRVLKPSADIFVPLVTHLINSPFAEGKFSASVTPQLKRIQKPIHNCAEAIDNYRPILNLQTISKILEKIFMSLVVSHVSSCPSFNRSTGADRNSIVAVG